MSRLRKAFDDEVEFCFHIKQPLLDLFDLGLSRLDVLVNVSLSE
jgi:hypothetical protein